MATETNKTFEEVGGISVRSEPIGYDAAELTACGSCGRANAPGRMECIYCGATLAVKADAFEFERSRTRELEAWENGFNVVLCDGDASDALAGLGLDDEITNRLTAFATASPVVRVASKSAADVIAARLNEGGSRAVVIGDEELALKTPPVRLRGIAIEDGRLTLTAFNSGERFEFAAEELCLIVTGTLMEWHSETQLKKKKGEFNKIDDSLIASDLGVADIFFQGESRGFRVLTVGFDFSVLGEKKGVRAAENLSLLVEMLLSNAGDARLVGDHGDKGPLLDAVWPCSVQRESKGVRRYGFGLAVSRGEVSSNAEQFTRYSRMLRLTI